MAFLENSRVLGLFLVSGDFSTIEEQVRLELMGDCVAFHGMHLLLGNSLSTKRTIVHVSDLEACKSLLHGKREIDGGKKSDRGILKGDSTSSTSSKGLFQYSETKLASLDNPSLGKTLLHVSGKRALVVATEESSAFAGSQNKRIHYIEICLGGASNKQQEEICEQKVRTIQIGKDGGNIDFKREKDGVWALTSRGDRLKLSVGGLDPLIVKTTTKRSNEIRSFFLEGKLLEFSNSQFMLKDPKSGLEIGQCAVSFSSEVRSFIELTPRGLIAVSESGKDFFYLSLECMRKAGQMSSIVGSFINQKEAGRSRSRSSRRRRKLASCVELFRNPSSAEEEMLGLLLEDQKRLQISEEQEVEDGSTSTTSLLGPFIFLAKYHPVKLRCLIEDRVPDGVVLNWIGRLKQWLDLEYQSGRSLKRHLREMKKENRGPEEAKGFKVSDFVPESKQLIAFLWLF